MNPDELPDFPLAPWELPPDSTEPLVAPATMVWHGELWGREADWLVRVVVEDHLRRPFICAEDRLDEAKWELMLMPLRGIGTQEQRATAIDNHIKQWGKYAHRVMYLVADEIEWTLIVEASGSTQLRSEEDMPRVEMNWPFDVVHATSEQLYAEFLRQWNDENSDLNFARAWSLFSQDEKYTLLVSWKRGGQSEFLNVMRLVLSAFVPHEAKDWCQWAFIPVAVAFVCTDIECYVNPHAAAPVALRVWGEALTSFFGPCWNEELARQHPCARDGGSYDAHHCRVPVRERTAHEQLEAAHQLSIWLDEREARGELDAATFSRLRATLR